MSNSILRINFDIIHTTRFFFFFPLVPFRIIMKYNTVVTLT